MIAQSTHLRPLRSTAAWLGLLLLVGMVVPAGSLAQPHDTADATTATVSAGNGCPATDVAGAPPGGLFSIGGRVTNDSNVGIADVQVQARGTIGLADTTTNASGDFVVAGLTDEDFVLSFYDRSGAYVSGFRGAIGLTIFRDDALPVDAGANPTNVDIVLPAEPDPLPVISGNILDSAGVPVEGVEVRAVPADNFPISGCGVSDANGHYAMPDVRVGQYLVSFLSETQPHGYYAAASSSHFVTRRSAATLVTVTANVPGIDIQFPASFSISGEVRNAANDAVEGIGLSACEVSEDGLCSSASSKPDGSFSLGVLVAGSYVIGQSDPSATYTSGYHVSGSAGVVADRSAADVLTIDANVSNVALLAVLNPRITGTVTDPQLVLLPAIDVFVCLLADANECRSGSTDVSGRFAVPVDPGSYVLRVVDPAGNHPAGYVGPGTVLVAGLDDAREVSVGANDEPIGSVAFAEGARISGIARTGGTPAPGVNFSICPSETNCVTEGYTGFDGLFNSPAVLPGAYLLGAFTEDGARIWYVLGGPAVTSGALATTITVGTADVTGIEFDVTSPGSSEPTPKGDDVPVVPTDPASGTTPVALTFDHVSIAGATSLAVSDNGRGAPAGFQLGVPPTWFDISTTASFVGYVTVCISYAGVTFPDETMLRLFHYNGLTNTWQDQTVSLDMVNDVICGRADSFSPFAVFQRTIAFTGFRSPIVSPPGINRANAGEAIPFAFGLGGDFGPSVLAAGSPASQRTDCTTGAPIGPIEATTSSDKKDTLRYDKKKQLYSYNWKTIKSWDGTCRQLTLTFSNGTTAEAAFDFRPEPKPPKPPKPPRGH